MASTRIDWKTLLRDHGVYYTDTGSNAARGNIYIKCPWCGPNDPSQHLGINFETGEWGCWRDSSHRGIKPHRLLMKLLHFTWDEVESLIGHVPLMEDSMSQVMRMLGSAKPKFPSRPETRTLEFPDEIRKFEGHVSSKPFLNYLNFRRGFNDPRSVVERYGLRYAINGPFRDRLVIPITLHHSLVSWTGRHIGNDPVRYKTLSVKTGEALLPSTSTLFEPPGIWSEGGILVITEGAIDALKLDHISFEYRVPIRATCLYGKVVHDDQVNLLMDLSELYSRMVILLDSGELKSSSMVESRLAPVLRCPVETLDLSRVMGKYREGPWKDPGGMSQVESKFFLRYLLQRS